MSESGDKYKLKITNVGVGDPFILIKAHFESGVGFISPAETALDSFTLVIKLSSSGGTSSSAYTQVGSITVNELATENDYYFGLPFDQGAFDPPSDLYVWLEASDASGTDIEIYGDDEYPNHDVYVQQLAYAGDPVDFENITVYYTWTDS
jgi:hypothetical protein